MASKLTFACLLVAVVGVVVIDIAQAQRFETLPYNPSEPPKWQKLPFHPNQRPILIREPYRPPSTQDVKVYRVRRDAGVGGKISSNPGGGADVVLQATQRVGSDAANLAATAFAAGNTNKGPVATGGSVGANLGDHGLSLSKTHVPGLADITSQNARVNLLNNGANKVDLNAFKTDTRLPTGFEFTKTGGNIDWNNVNGYGATLGASRIPNLGTTYEAAARANLWQSMDRRTTVDLMGTASKTQGGLFNGRSDFGTSVGLTHIFG